MPPFKLKTASQKLAVFFGIFLGVFEVFYNWSNPSWWPFILVDYIAVGLLLYGAFKEPKLLPIGWGFSCAMFYMAFFLMWQQNLGLVVVGAGILFLITIVGLLLELSSAIKNNSSQN